MQDSILYITDYTEKCSKHPIIYGMLHSSMRVSESRLCFLWLTVNIASFIDRSSLARCHFII